jgi:hypothetical protein
MRNTFLYLLLAGSTTLLSCGNESQTNPPVGETEQQPTSKDYCFRQVTGKDTLKVHLHVDGEQVTGDMDSLPDQKDARRGGITGIIVGNEIKATWHFQQEGMNDSMQVAFKLTEEALKTTSVYCESNFWQ